MTSGNNDNQVQWWHQEDGAVVCELCPRQCRIETGKSGFCRVRKNLDGVLVLETYGRVTGFCIDPIEKKPLYHFLPGTPTLSFGSVGCNLACRHCQNADSVFAASLETAHEMATPEMIASAAKKLDIPSVSFTYNEPVIAAEFVVETGKACHAHGIKTVAVTNGYIASKPRSMFFKQIDAANVDLKSFCDSFYRDIAGATLKPVLETLEYLAKETDVWVEVTTLLIPGENDTSEEIAAMCDWFLNTLGPDVPLHFSAFHPTYRLLDRLRTPIETMLNAEQIARSAGINHVYLGNLNLVSAPTTICSHCRKPLFSRTEFGIEPYAVMLPFDDSEKATCLHCGTNISGRFQQRFGNWGNKRQAVRF